MVVAFVDRFCQGVRKAIAGFDEQLSAAQVAVIPVSPYAGCYFSNRLSCDSSVWGSLLGIPLQPRGLFPLQHQHPILRGRNILSEINGLRGPVARFHLGLDRALIESPACCRVKIVDVPIDVRLKILHDGPVPVISATARLVDKTHFAWYPRGNRHQGYFSSSFLPSPSCVEPG